MPRTATRPKPSSKRNTPKRAPRRSPKRKPALLTPDHRRELIGISFMRLGEAQTQPIESISTGALTLDIALGVGGIPRGRVVEIYGPESSGKTTLTLHAAIRRNRQGEGNPLGPG